ncbi:MAG: tetratricopeptide repeat protein [Planctomycetota bacterium]
MGSDAATRADRQAQLERVIRQRDSLARTETLIELAWDYSQQDAGRAAELVEQCLASPVDATGRARALVIRSFVEWRQGRFRSACEDAERALEDLVDDDHLWRSRAFNSLGAAAYHLGAFDEASARYEQALALVDRHGGERGGLISNIGLIHLHQGRYAEARPFFDEAFALACRAGNETHQGNIRVNLGNLEFNLGRYGAALAQYEAAAGLFESLGSDFLLGDVLIKIGSVHTMLRHDTKKALRSFRRALELLGDGNSPIELAWGYQRLAELQIELGDREGARASYEQSLAICEEHEYEGVVALCLNGLANLSLDDGDLETARKLRHRALAAARARGIQHELAWILHALGADHLEARDFGSAEEALQAAAEYLDKESVRYEASAVHRTLCDLYLARGDHPRALEHLRTHGALRADVDVDAPR